MGSQRIRQDWATFTFKQFLAMLDLHCCAGFSLVCGESESHSVFPRLYSPWNSPDQNTGVGSLSLLQGIFSTQGSNPGLPHCRWILYQLSHKGSPRTLEWVAFPFSRGSFRPRNWTQVSYTAGGFFTSWATREAQEYCLIFKQNQVGKLYCCSDKFHSTHMDSIIKIST